MSNDKRIGYIRKLVPNNPDTVFFSNGTVMEFSLKLHELVEAFLEQRFNKMPSDALLTRIFSHVKQGLFSIVQEGEPITFEDVDVAVGVAIDMFKEEHRKRYGLGSYTKRKPASGGKTCPDCGLPK